MVLGARDKGWRDAERAIDRARARFGRSSVRPGKVRLPVRVDDRRGSSADRACSISANNLRSRSESGTGQQ